MFPWFEQWIMHRATLNELSVESGYSKRKLQSLFDQYLLSPPTFVIHRRISLYLIVDGTYFNEGLCLILYYDSELKYALLYRFSTNEFYTEIKENLENLKQLGIDVSAVTSDGKRAIINAVKKVYPNAVVQRCMVHVQRDVLKWLTRKPKSEAAKELRYLAGLLHHIRGMVEQHMWIIAFEKWYSKHRIIIEQKVYHTPTGRWWYKHRALRRAAVMIKRANADMFHFIGNGKIPKTTNALDSYFGHLKGTLNIHRGLSKEHRKGFILRYLHLKSIR